MEWKLSNNGSIKISDEAKQKIKFYIQDKSDSLEAGGVLLGRFIIESKNIVIDDVRSRNQKINVNAIHLNVMKRPTKKLLQQDGILAKRPVTIWAGGIHIQKMIQNRPVLILQDGKNI